MAQFEEDIKEIEEEILDEKGDASIKTSFKVFKRNFTSHVLNVRILFGILISLGIVQTVFVILIFLKLFYPWVFA